MSPTGAKSRSEWRPIVLIGACGTIAGMLCVVGCDQGSPKIAPASSTSTATGGHASTSETNAAEEYLSIYAAIDASLVAKLRDSPGELPTEFEDMLTASRPLRNRLVQTTHHTHCDWGVDYRTGIPAELPHLKAIRELSRFLRAHAHLAIRVGDMNAAAENVAALMRLSRHVGGRFLIEKAVAIATLRMALQLVSDHPGQWTGLDRSLVGDELIQIDASDPFECEESIAWEQSVAPGLSDANAFRQLRQLVVHEIFIARRILEIR